MKKQFTKLSIAIAAVTAASLGTIHAQSLEISGVVTQTVGSAGAAIATTGNASNTNFWTSNTTVGVFNINAYSTGNTPPVIGTYYMQVVASLPGAPTSLYSGTDSLMVARTVNSQGLTDNGTLSVYVRPVGSDTTPGVGETPAQVTGVNWTLNLTFNFFSDAALTTPATLDLLLTSLDIDNSQKYYTNNADFDGGNFTYPGTALTTASPTIPGYTGFTASTPSVVNNPLYAVSSAGNGSSFSVTLGHSERALYMFEFRNPSEIVPEPSTAVLATISGFMLVAFLRRVRRVIS